jgi:hypothetical protein
MQDSRGKAVPLKLRSGARSPSARAAPEKTQDISAHVFWHIFDANGMHDRESLLEGIQECDTVRTNF